ncbi:hypothetical protein TNCV_2222861 [Trichonephila clavipes]|nr:hypothetical protein TNCV_2222861 [Trichonephila clavipes]
MYSGKLELSQRNPFRVIIRNKLLQQVQLWTYSKTMQGVAEFDGQIQRGERCDVDEKKNGKKRWEINLKDVNHVCNASNTLQINVRNAKSEILAMWVIAQTYGCIQTNLVCWRCQLKRRQSVPCDLQLEIYRRTQWPRYPNGQGIGSWMACHEFKPSTTKDPACRSVSKVPRVGNGVTLIFTHSLSGLQKGLQVVQVEKIQEIEIDMNTYNVPGLDMRFGIEDLISLKKMKCPWNETLENASVGTERKQ